SASPIRRPVFRHDHPEDEPSSSGIEMRRLAFVPVAAVEAVLRAHGNVDRLFRIAVVIAVIKSEGSVGIRLPAVEGRAYIVAARILDSRIGKLGIKGHQT